METGDLVQRAEPCKTCGSRQGFVFDKDYEGGLPLIMCLPCYIESQKELQEEE